ncbi:hypothetical protein HOY82DRAFT_619616 [Tuber indicum]|nr:hypothetical protein HOY82DRAFT_619616 [Tuber indicum]
MECPNMSYYFLNAQIGCGQEAICNRLKHNARPNGYSLYPFSGGMSVIVPNVSLIGSSGHLIFDPLPSDDVYQHASIDLSTLKVHLYNVPATCWSHQYRSCGHEYILGGQWPSPMTGGAILTRPCGQASCSTCLVGRFALGPHHEYTVPHIAGLLDTTAEEARIYSPPSRFTHTASIAMKSMFIPVINGFLYSTGHYDPEWMLPPRRPYLPKQLICNLCS